MFPGDFPFIIHATVHIHLCSWPDCHLHLSTGISVLLRNVALLRLAVTSSSLFNWCILFDLFAIAILSLSPSLFPEIDFNLIKNWSSNHKRVIFLFSTLNEYFMTLPCGSFAVSFLPLPWQICFLVFSSINSCAIQLRDEKVFRFSQCPFHPPVYFVDLQ